MSENTFQGISESDMKYLVYLSKNRFDSFAKLCIETDLSAEYRIKELIKGGYLILKDGDICFTFKTVTAITDYRDYMKERSRHEKQEHLRIWIPVIINSILSLSAIVISVIALLMT